MKNKQSGHIPEVIKSNVKLCICCKWNYTDSLDGSEDDICNFPNLSLITGKPLPNIRFSNNMRAGLCGKEAKLFEINSKRILNGEICQTCEKIFTPYIIEGHPLDCRECSDKKTIKCDSCLEEIYDDEEFETRSFIDGTVFYTCLRCVEENSEGIDDANNSVRVDE